MISIDLTSYELKIFLDLLGRVGDALGNAGCNDYSLSGNGELSDTEARELFRRMKEVFPKDMEDSTFDNSQPDWFLMAYMEERLKRAQ
jgi:hypothetical protein